MSPRAHAATLIVTLAVLGGVLVSSCYPDPEEPACVTAGGIVVMPGHEAADCAWLDVVARRSSEVLDAVGLHGDDRGIVIRYQPLIPLPDGGAIAGDFEYGGPLQERTIHTYSYQWSPGETICHELAHSRFPSSYEICGTTARCEEVAGEQHADMDDAGINSKCRAALRDVRGGL